MISILYSAQKLIEPIQLIKQWCYMDSLRCTHNYLLYCNLDHLQLPIGIQGDHVKHNANGVQAALKMQTKAILATITTYSSKWE